MAKLGALMQAAVSGGEAKPNVPDFDRVMMVTGEIKTPQRILPVLGFHGQELCPSQVGVQLGLGDQADQAQQGLVDGVPEQARFNYLDPERQHVEGGRYRILKKRTKEMSTIKGNKGIKQNLTLSSDEDDRDEDYVPKGTV